VKDAIDYAQIDIWKHNSWALTTVNFVGTDVEADIAVLACAARFVGADLDIPVERDSRSGAGQEVFFIGFPFDLTGSGLVLPLIRRGIVSNFRFEDPAHMLVSALANPGFSGSPLFYVNHETGQATLTAIVASSLGYRAPVLNAQKKMIGTVEMDLNLVQCPFIRYALSLIERNPIGFCL
jgi:S1-C subfamily serine protease